MNSAKTDYIFLHPGKKCDKILGQNISDSRNSTSQTSTVSNSQTSTTASNISSQNSAQNSAQNSSQNSVQNSAQNSVQNSSQNSVQNSVQNSAQNSIQNSQNSAQNSIQNSQNSAQNSSQNSSYNSQEDILEVEILQSEGFKNRFQAKTYINESRGFLCTSECPFVPANFGKKLIPFLQNLAYSNSSNIFYVLEDFKNQCLQQISLHAPCFQGLRTIKRKYNELIRHVKIMASVNQIFQKCNFKILENFVNNQKLPIEIAEELHTKFLPKVSDLTEPMATAKYGILMEKFFKDDQDIAASFCQICHQIFRASSLMQMKYEIVEELCVQAIPGNLKENYRKESKILISVCVECRNNIKKV
uniref:Uncharacterized protein n=1 Tax=Panagrolaimus superbus TaxID=310955 RepID=A0A914XZW5_9BILA